MSDHVSEISDVDFQGEVLECNIPVLVDFWAPWCAPCRSIAPIIDEIAKEYNGQVKVVKMNVDENPQTPSDFQVRGIPNLVLFKGGNMEDQIVGFVAKQDIVNAIEKLL